MARLSLSRLPSNLGALGLLTFLAARLVRARADAQRWQTMASVQGREAEAARAAERRLQTAFDDAEYLINRDSLTGLLNRQAFSEQLDSHAALVERYGATGVVLVVDLDHFRFFNDTLGQQAGDQLIARVAELFAARLRASDVLARLGGDEFGVLLPMATGEAAVNVAGSLLAALRDESIDASGLGQRITASIGIARFETASISGAEVLVNADVAMYDAKDHGRDCAVVFGAAHGDHAGTRGRGTWVQRMRAALKDDRFELLAQPIVDLSTGTADQYELLLRMRDDHDDLLEPGSFLHVAEELDMIEEIDMWVVSHGLRMLAEESARDVSRPSFEINLSAASIGSARLLDHIETEIEETGVDPACVIFEITETAALRSISRARAFGGRLSEIGCRFALDDFGAGFGSFYYLKHLYFDLIKIDGEFVQHCRSSETDQLLIRAIVEIARGLHKQTVAEFVSDDETIDLLRTIGVDFGQGYHLGVPAPLRGRRLLFGADEL